MATVFAISMPTTSPYYQCVPFSSQSHEVEFLVGAETKHYKELRHPQVHVFRLAPHLHIDIHYLISVVFVTPSP